MSTSDSVARVPTPLTVDRSTEPTAIGLRDADGVTSAIVMIDPRDPAEGLVRAYAMAGAEVMRAALEDTRRLALAVVGASEAYGETESAHLWQEVAGIADKALTLAASAPPTREGDRE